VTLVERKSGISLEYWDSHMWSGIDVHGLFFGTEGTPKCETTLTRHEFVVPLEEKQERDLNMGRLST